jgi:hypothetical protein
MPSFAFAQPDYISKLLPWDRESRCKISEDWCIVDEELFYIRGCLEIPIIGSSEPFSLGVWSTLSVDDFDMTMELWSDPSRVNEPPYLGMLANDIPFYENTRVLQTKVQTRKPGERPLIFVPDKHPLGIDQRDGITAERVAEFEKMVTEGKASNPYAYLCER